MLVRTQWCRLEAVEAEGISRGAILAYAKLGFIILETRKDELWLSRDDAERLFRAERIRRDLGANVVGAALVVETLERFGQ